MFIIRKTTFEAYVSPEEAYYNQMDNNYDRIEEAIADSPIRETIVISIFEDLKEAQNTFEKEKKNTKSTVYYPKTNCYIGEMITLDEESGHFPDEIDRFIDIKP